ncbi:MAG: CBS domain-containing protein [Chloroflexota bacterium]|jgi:signal-transduction protein with cAMP-binding, CBS, and nucleotidyltransferase domain|nr:CBS domain-containing protein [Chloroflexota bacterium]
MQDLVKDWMIDLVVYIDPESTVLEALSKMRRRYLNSLIVSKTKENPEYGIITSTDVCDKIVAQDRDPADLKVKDIMTSPIIGVDPEQTIFECAKEMSEHHIHHLPVIDHDKNIVGMVSATDFLVVAEAMGHGEGDQHLR